MAVRLSLKLGVVNERDRSPDSPDTIVVVEPTIGSVARSKGSLYLLVTSTVPGARAREATRLAAETIRDEYYYDESAGIRACLEKVIALANKRLAHHRDKLGVAASATTGPVGIAVAVVRGGELYVSTVGPAEAYLIRSARLSTLPDPHRDHGLPTGDLSPDVWRGEISVGDSLVLIAPNVVARLGPDELKDAMVTLHPQSAMEHLHHRFVAVDGSGSDGAIALEATEVSATARQRALVPVRPDEPLAGTPDRSPIPLADGVEAGVAAMSAGATRARDAAGGVFGQSVRALQDRLPHRNAAYRKVTPFATKQETQRRAAVAVLAFVVVAVGLGFGVWVAGGSGTKADVASLSAGAKALQDARDSIDEVWAPGVDLVEGDPRRAEELLETAYTRLDEAESKGIPATTVDPLKARVVDGLDVLYKVIEVRPSVVFSFPDADPPVELTALVRGPDSKAFVIDKTSGTVLRIDARAGEAQVILRAGDTVDEMEVGAPKLLTVGGPDLLVLDANNTVWRWRAADKEGRGTVKRVRVKDSASWGNDVLAIGTFCRSGDCSLYNLYVVDPSERQILFYTPAADGGGYPSDPTGRLATARDVTPVTDLYIDGDIWLADAGAIERFVSGRDDGWRPADVGDDLLRPAPVFTRVASGTSKRTGTLYGYDRANQRVLAYDKATGDFIEQYRLTGRNTGWRDIHGIVISPGIEDGPTTFVWIDRDRLMTTVLEESLGGSPARSGSGSPSGSPGGSASPAASGSAEASTAP